MPWVIKVSGLGFWGGKKIQYTGLSVIQSINSCQKMALF